MWSRTNWSRSASRTTLHVIGPGLPGKPRVNACTLIGMHAESHLEVAEKKGEGRREGSVDVVKFREIANTVNSLDV